jgi:hypothetical protein
VQCHRRGGELDFGGEVWAGGGEEFEFLILDFGFWPSVAPNLADSAGAVEGWWRVAGYRWWVVVREREAERERRRGAGAELL